MNYNVRGKYQCKSFLLILFKDSDNESFSLILSKFPVGCRAAVQGSQMKRKIEN